MCKVSVIIPTYNRASYLFIAIRSILNQEFSDFEIIVSDNACTDNTFEIVKSFNDKRIVYHRNETNIGIAGNHNKALELCSGEYIHIFSDDDVMLKDCLKVKVEILDLYPTVGLIHSDTEFIDSDGNITSQTHWGPRVWKNWSLLHSKSSFFSKEDYHNYLMNIYNIISMPSVMIRKSVISKVGYMDTKLNFIIDWDYWLKITLFFDVYFIKDKTVAYRIHNYNLTKSMTDLSVKNEINIIKNNIIKDFPNDYKFKRNRFKDFLQQGRFYYDYNYYRITKFLIKRILLKIGI